MVQMMALLGTFLIILSVDEPATTSLSSPSITTTSGVDVAGGTVPPVITGGSGVESGAAVEASVALGAYVLHDCWALPVACWLHDEL